MKNKPLKKRIAYILLAALLPALLLSGCNNSASSTDSEDGIFKNQLLHNTLYKYPKIWVSENVRGGGIYHYPPDGGMLFVSPAIWGRTDLTIEDNAKEAFEYTIGLMEKNMPGFTLLLYEDATVYLYRAVHIKFTTDAGNQTAGGEAWIFALPEEKEIMQFIFVFPNIENSELETYKQEIIDSIV